MEFWPASAGREMDARSAVAVVLTREHFLTPQTTKAGHGKHMAKDTSCTTQTKPAFVERTILVIEILGRLIAFCCWLQLLVAHVYLCNAYSCQGTAGRDGRASDILWPVETHLTSMRICMCHMQKACCNENRSILYPVPPPVSKFKHITVMITRDTTGRSAARACKHDKQDQGGPFGLIFLLRTSLKGRPLLPGLGFGRTRFRKQASKEQASRHA